MSQRTAPHMNPRTPPVTSGPEGRAYSGLLDPVGPAQITKQGTVGHEPLSTSGENRTDQPEFRFKSRRQSASRERTNVSSRHAS